MGAARPRAHVKVRRGHERVATAAITGETGIWTDPKITRASPSPTPSTTHCATYPRIPDEGALPLGPEVPVLIDL